MSDDATRLSCSCAQIKRTSTQIKRTSVRHTDIIAARRARRQGGGRVRAGCGRQPFGPAVSPANSAYRKTLQKSLKSVQKPGKNT